VIRLSLAKNVAFNIMNEKTIVDLMQTLSNMYEKPSVANKVYLIRRLVNLKVGEGNSVTNHISEVKALILLSSLLESWSVTVTTVSNPTSNNKLKLDIIRNLILSEDVHRKSSRESPSSNFGSALSTENRGRSS